MLKALPIIPFQIFKSGTHGRKLVHAWFFEITLVHMLVCVHVCEPPRSIVWNIDQV